MGERQLGRPLPGPGALGLRCCTGTPEDPGASGASQRVPWLGGGGSWLSDPNTLDWRPKQVHESISLRQEGDVQEPGRCRCTSWRRRASGAAAPGTCGLPDLWN